MRVHDLIRPLKTYLDEALKENKQYEGLLKSSLKEIDQLKRVILKRCLQNPSFLLLTEKWKYFKEYEEQKRKHHADIIESQKVYYELADTKTSLQQSNFKRDNYDRTKL